ncbi:hypothetical protein DB32_001420 [Sandaracinus amylolyticus]|uniref:Uncharacterized protein n=2 Tax=Sandaracinus amylolyticus TaxID=927083 RepID=A0A0F6W0Q2_9BACT|nr:hypothetical protein DB32_001420 [Sandaracinus amylolyticus]
MTIKALGRPLSPERFASLTSTEIERLRSTIQASLDAMREELAPDARALQVTADQVRDAVGRIVSRCPAS